MALVFCILTDVACTFILNVVGVKSGIETIATALVVFLAVKAAPHIAEPIIRLPWHLKGITEFRQ